MLSFYPFSFAAAIVRQTTGLSSIATTLPCSRSVPDMRFRSIIARILTFLSMPSWYCSSIYLTSSQHCLFFDPDNDGVIWPVRTGSDLFLSFFVARFTVCTAAEAMIRSLLPSSTTQSDTFRGLWQLGYPVVVIVWATVIIHAGYAFFGLSALEYGL